jgi:hypothetical protein
MYMKVVMLYRPNSEQARQVEEYARDIERQQNVQPQLLDVDSPEGGAMMTLYGIMSHPAVVVTREDGELIQYWANDQLPLMQEVAAFARG